MAPLVLFLFLFLCFPHNPLPLSHAQHANPTFNTDPFPEPSIYAYPFLGPTPSTSSLTRCSTKCPEQTRTAGEPCFGTAPTTTTTSPTPRSPRIFENKNVYFALPNSIVFGRPVHASRSAFGRALAEESPVPGADVVIPVPDSGFFAALGFSEASGVPFQQGLLRSHYVGRTFTQPSQVIRDLAVKLKPSPVPCVPHGRSVVVVDDSLVRGTTSSKIVRLLRGTTRGRGRGRETNSNTCYRTVTYTNEILALLFTSFLLSLGIWFFCFNY